MLPDLQGVKNPIDISECIANELNPRQKGKNVKNLTKNAAGREVTYPVTHLPIKIHDFSINELTMVPENISPNEPSQQTSTKADAESTRLEYERKQSRLQHKGLERLFPPPDFEAMRAEFANAYKCAITIGLGSVLVLATVLHFGVFWVGLGSTNNRFEQDVEIWIHFLVFLVAILIIVLGIDSSLIWAVRGWLNNDSIREDQVWDTARRQERNDAEIYLPA